MSVTPHANQVGEVVSLTAGNQTLRSILDTVKPGMSSHLKGWSFRIESGGPVSWGRKTLTVIGDGSIYGGVGEGFSEDVGGDRRTIDAGLINLFATNTGDKCYISAFTA